MWGYLVQNSRAKVHFCFELFAALRFAASPRKKLTPLLRLLRDVIPHLRGKMKRNKNGSGDKEANKLMD